MKKTLILFLAAALLLPLAACGETGDKPGSDTAAPGEPTDSQSVPFGKRRRCLPKKTDLSTLPYISTNP